MKTEHLEILNKGIEEWNNWRKVSNEIPDLEGVELINRKFEKYNFRNTIFRKAILSGSNFIKADIRNAYFNGATLIDTKFNYAQLNDSQMASVNLTRASFIRAKLSGVDFSGSILEQVNFRSASLNSSNLTGANLSNAYLKHANMRNTIIRSANLENANFDSATLKNAIIVNTNLRSCKFFKTKISYTTFSNIKLNEIKFLHTVWHKGPSIVDEKSLIISKDIPIKFLRGIGLSESFIKFLPELQKKEVSFGLNQLVFISYSRKDNIFANWLYEYLQNSGIRCWLDEKAIKYGEDIYEAVNQGIKDCDKMILICSQSSLKSWWVVDEMKKTLERERQGVLSKSKKTNILIPVSIDKFIYDWEGALGSTIRNKNICDLSNWKVGENHSVFSTQLDKLVHSIKTLE